ncbi:MAG: hypothetical protein JSU77_11845 [Fidelibacterota bacterium]|nr:MAG: hypothetical protein JSU77_11845 [Candidatus Neomarinimicrobiota bacterium]
MHIKGDATFEDLKAQYPELVELSESKYGSPLPKPMQQLLLDMATSSVMKVEQTVAWIIGAADVTYKVLKGHAYSAEYPIFWIKLNGIVDEYYEEENEFRSFNELISFKKPIMRSLDSLRAKLTEEDLSFIKFMRHSYCHISLHYLWHRAKVKKGKIVKVLPPYDPNARDIAARIIEEHNGNQRAVAHTYASRIAEDLFNLRNAVTEAAEDK